MTSAIPLLACALAFGFLNGFHDSSNIVATAISSRALPPRQALLLAAIAEYCGPFLFGTAVATTIGSELVTPGAITVQALTAALLSAIVWNIVTWRLGFPASSSHALIGGLLGATLVTAGSEAIRYRGLLKVLAALFLSPPLGVAVGYLVMKGVLFVAQWFSPRLNSFFKRVQIATSVALALSHGANDAQKTMGVIALGLVAGGYLDAFYVPRWVVAISAATMSLGVATGGWRLIRTLGGGFYHIRAVHGFSAQLTAGLVIFGAALSGGPISATQVVSSAIVGVGAAERRSKVRWGVARQIAMTWLLTIPATALVAAALQWVTTGLLYPGGPSG